MTPLLDRETELLLRGHRALAYAFENVRIPDGFLARVYETLRKHGAWQ